MNRILILIGLFNGVLSAQTTPPEQTRTEIVKVRKSFTPKIKRGTRIRIEPKPKEIKTKRLTPTYQVTKQSIDTGFDLPAISEIPKKSVPKVGIKNNYLSFGMGNNISPQFLGYTSYDLPIGLIGVYAYFHSAQKSDDDLKLTSNSFANLDSKISYQQKWGNYQFVSNLSYRYGDFSFFGLNETLQNIDPKDNVLDVTTYAHRLDLGIGVELVKASTGFNFSKLWVNLVNYQDNWQNSMQSVGLLSKFEMPLESELIDVEIEANQYKHAFNYDSLLPKENLADWNAPQVNLFRLSPNFEVYRSQFEFKLGLHLFYRTDNRPAHQDKLGIYPNISMDYALVDQILIMYAKIGGGMQENSLVRNRETQKFISPVYAYTYSSVLADITLGLKGVLSSQLNFFIEGSAKRYDQMPIHNLMFDPSLSVEIDPNHPSLHHNSLVQTTDSAWTFALEGELTHRISNLTTKLDAKAELTLPDHFQQPFIHQNLSYYLNLSNSWEFYPRWTWINTAYLEMGRQIGLINQPQKTTISQVIQGTFYLPEATIKSQSLDAIIDLNSELWYRFSQNLSVYTKLNNWLNQRYEFLTNTPSLGLQFYAGLSYQF